MSALTRRDFLLCAAVAIVAPAILVAETEPAAPSTPVAEPQFGMYAMTDSGLVTALRASVGRTVIGEFGTFAETTTIRYVDIHQKGILVARSQWQPITVHAGDTLTVTFGVNAT